MEQRKKRKPPTPEPVKEQDGPFDFQALLHPAQAFEHPADVVNDPDLTLSEKRAILSSWASDACAVEAIPALRQPAGAKPVAFDEVIDALKALDRQAQQKGFRPRPHYRRVLENRVPGIFGRKSTGGDDRGQPLN